MSANREVTPATLQLFAASETGDATAVAALVKDPTTDINWHRKQSYGATALIGAIVNGHAKVVQILLDAGADLGELKTPDRNSPLHEAAFRDEPEIMDMLLRQIKQDDKKPASELIDLQNQFGNTPLHNAARSASSACVEILLKAGAKPSIANINGSYPLHHACYCEKPNAQVVRLLVEAGSDVNHQDEQGYTPLMVAAKKDQAEAIQYLREHGADVTAKNQFGEDALHFAKLRDSKSAMLLLLG